MTRKKTAYLSGRITKEYMKFLRSQAARFAVSQSVFIETATRFFAVSGEWTTCRNCGGDNLNSGPNGCKCTCDHCGACLWPGECE